MLSEEPPSESHVFHKAGGTYPNLILTPHVGISDRTMRAMIMAAADEAQRVVNGEKPRYPVNTLANRAPGGRGGPTPVGRIPVGAPKLGHVGRAPGPHEGRWTA